MIRRDIDRNDLKFSFSPLDEVALNNYIHNHQRQRSKAAAEEKDINLFKKYTDPKFSGVKNSYGNVGCHAALFETDKKAWESGKVNKNLEARPKAGSSKKIA